MSTDQVDRALLQVWSPDFWDWGLHQLQNLFQNLLQCPSLLIITKEHKLLQKDVYLSCRREQKQHIAIDTGILNNCISLLSTHRKDSTNSELVLFLLRPCSVWEQNQDKSVAALRRLLFSAPNFKCSELTCYSELRGRLTKPRSNTDGCMDQAAFLPSIHNKNKRGSLYLSCTHPHKLQHRLRSPTVLPFTVSTARTLSPRTSRRAISSKGLPSFRLYLLRSALRRFFEDRLKRACSVTVCTTGLAVSRVKSEGTSTVCTKIVTQILAFFSGRGLCVTLCAVTMFSVLLNQYP